jgi:hypothetical protein
MLTKDKLLHCCRICGLYYNDYYPWEEDGTCPTYDFCHCCNVEFGVADYCEESIIKYRVQWLKKGAKWAEKKLCPLNWDIKEQLENIMSSEEVEQLLEQYLSDNEKKK